MSRPATGQVVVQTLLDGTHVFKLRFQAYGRREHEVLHERRNCQCGCGGGWNERTAHVELENVMAKVRAGVWRKRQLPPPAVKRGVPSFHEYASDWLEAKRDGVLGDRPISRNTELDYRSRLSNHLLPFFGDHRLSEIDAELCLAFKAYKIKEAAELRRTLDAGAKLTDRQGRMVRPLSPTMIHKLIACLTAVLDEAVEDGYLERNPARSRRMRVNVPKPARTFLEMDELVALTDAAGEQDAKFARPKLPVKPEPGSTAALVAERWLAGKRAFEISDELGLARATVTYHLRRMEAKDPGYYVGRRAIIATLAGSGVRVSELCDIRIRDLRLHAAAGARYRIPDAKTEAGIREVQVSPDLLEEIVAHIDRLRRADQPTEPEAYLFPNRKGRRMTRQRASEIVRDAATLASTHLAARGLPALPTTSPHTLRRTYISIALLANRFDVLWVMRQVGHADSHMTMDVYAQLQQRAERQHGEAFDGLVRQARERLYGSLQQAGGEDADAQEEPRLEDVVNEWRDERDES